MLSTEHSLQPSADARAILTPKDVKLCCMFSSFLGRVSRDYFICLSVIINYDFDLSVFIFPKGGVKMDVYVQQLPVLYQEVYGLQHLVQEPVLHFDSSFYKSQCDARTWRVSLQELFAAPGRALCCTWTCLLTRAL